MLKTITVQKIVNNYSNSFLRTHIGGYAYSLQFWYGKWYIVRCKKGEEDRTYIRDKEILTDWERICEYNPKTGETYPCTKSNRIFDV